MTFQCPHCSRELASETQQAGQVVECPHCHKSMSIPAGAGAAPPAGPHRLAGVNLAAPGGGQALRGPLGRKEADATHHLKFECPQCRQHLSITPAAAGLVIQCPSCGNRIRVPDFRKTERQAWKETDPTNPHFLQSLGIGFGLLVVWFGLMWPFIPPAGMPIAEYSTLQFLASLFYKHFVVSFLNTLFFSWAMAIIFLKHRKIRHQKAALLLDVLPTHLGREIDADNVAVFIEHVYSLPVRLRDSLMVNRIRKALELFEIRQNVSDVREMMASQSEIDSARIGGSYTLLRAFLWGIPLLGFIGTVVGLSQAIGGMNFANVEDIGKIVGAINNVTSGLGTAFDATLLGLVLALTLNFPLNALAKQEDDNLHTIDAFCNEVLLPRLKDAAIAPTAGSAGVADSILRSLAGTQEKFLADLKHLALQMNEYAGNLDRRMEAFQQTVSQEFVTKTTEMRAQHQAALKEAVDQIVKFQQTLGSAAASQNDQLRAETDKALKESLEKAAKYLGGLEGGIGGLNKVLKELGEKQVVIAPPKKKRWFSRD